MKKQIKVLLYILVIISFISCIRIGILRVETENMEKSVQIAVRYSDVLSIAQQKQISVEEVLKQLKAAGATTLFVKENSVMPLVKGEYYNFKEQGKVTVFEGSQIQSQLKEELSITPHFTYIQGKDPEVMDSIYNNLKYKNVPVSMFQAEDKIFIEVREMGAVLTNIGVGFNYEDLKIAANLGYVIVPQMRYWGEASDESVAFVISELEKINSLGPIYFADQEIPGYDSGKMKQFIEKQGIGFVEFFSGNQKGFQTLATDSSRLGTDYKVMRLHTLADDEVKKYKLEDMMDRYTLALRERNIRTFLFKMPVTLNIERDMNTLIEYISTFKQEAESLGFHINNEQTFINLPVHRYIPTLFSGIAAIVVFILLCDNLKLRKLGYILGIIGFVGYAGLLKVAPLLTVKLMALFGAIIFPVYAVLTALDHLKHQSKDIKAVLWVYFRTALISFGGGLTVVGVLSRTSYAVGLDVFPGVKVATIFPIFLVIICDMYKRHGLDYQYYKNLLLSKVSYLVLGILGVLAVALLIYAMRTGNTGEISDLERSFRTLLDNLLGVRPRTKEFLIGHPLFVVLLYYGYRYGYKEQYIPLLVFAVIGQVSLVNTYAHIHTPLVVSLIRTGYGLMFGLAIGFIFVGAIKLMIKVMSQWITQQE